MAKRIKASGLPVINDHAAGIDIGSLFHVVAVPPDRCDESVQTFQAFTGDLHRMSAWLKSIGVTTVAMGVDREAGKLAHRFIVPIRWHRHQVGRAADVDAGGVRVGNR